MAKKIIKKIMVNVLMAIVMMLVGFGIGTAMYSAGFRFNLPRISVEWYNEDHDLILIDRASMNTDSDNRVSGDDALASN